MPYAKVSVLIPCYNSEDYIASALESALSQTHKPAEIIVVDDGSEDKSCEIVDSFRRAGVRLIRQQNAGASTARNNAFRASSGKFILFLDADDVINATHLESLISRCENDPHCIAMSRWGRFHGDITEAECVDRPSYRDDDGISWLVSEWENARGMTQPGMFLIRRSMIEAVGLWNEKVSFNDDFEFFARLISRCRRMSFAAEAKLYYRSGIPNSLSKRRDTASVRNAFEGLLMGTEHLIEAEDSVRTRRACANVLKNFVYEYYPRFPDLRRDAEATIARLGGADLRPAGPPGFAVLRPLIGWRFARRIQRAAEFFALNGASRRALFSGVKRT